MAKDTVLLDEDTCTERMMKKMSELNTNFNPLMMGVAVSVVVGRSYAFEFTVYLFALVCCFVFNVFKVHRACIDFFLTRWAIEIVFYVCAGLMIIGLMTSEHSSMLYTLK